MDTIGHWIAGQETTATSQRYGPVYDPATGRADRAGRVGERGGRGCGGRVGHCCRRPPGARRPLARRIKVLFAFRELLDRNRDELAAAITAEHGKTIDDALGEVQRGLEVVEFACGIPALMQGEYSANVSTEVDAYSIRQPLGVVAGITPVQLPGHGADVDVPGRDRVRQRVRAEAVGEGPVGVPAGRPAVAAGGAARRRLHRSCTATSRVGQRDARPSRALPPSPSSGRRRSRAMSTNAAPRRASGCRRSAAPRTTWWCCPTPTSASAADAAVSAGYGSAGERCMAISAVVAVGDTGDALVEAIAERTRALRTGPGNADDSQMGPLVTRAHRDKVAGYVDAADHRGRRPRGGRARGVGRRRRLLPRPGRCSTTSPPQMSIYTDEIFGPLLSVLRAESYDEALALVNANPVRQRHRDLHQRRSRRPAVPAGGAGRHGRDQRPDPDADVATSPSVAGSSRCSATPTCTAGTACTSTPGPRPSPPGGRRPTPNARCTWASRPPPDPDQHGRLATFDGGHRRVDRRNWPVNRVT